MSTPAPDISVVIPCHNAGRWIGEAIASVVEQAGVRLELVVVDDGSDDDSVERANRFSGQVPLTIIRQPQSGASRARNAGTQAARGAFIQYLDADDVLTAGTLGARMAALKDGAGDVAYCDWVRWEERPGGVLRDREIVRRRTEHRLELAVLAGRAWWPPGAVLYRRAIVDAIGCWREELPVIQDARFLIDAALAGARFVHVPAIGMKYREHPASLSRRDQRAFLEDCYRNGCDLQVRWEREGSLDAERRRCLAGLYADLMQSFFRIDRRRFREIAARLEQLDPAFVPDGSAALRALSRVGGYPAAVRIATWYRQLRTLGHRA